MTSPYLSQQPVTDFGLLQSDQKFGAKLPDNAAIAFTVPAQSRRYKAVIKVSSDAWVSVNNTAVIPVLPTFSSVNVELIKTELCREVVSGDVLSFICPVVNTFVSIVLYSL